MLTARWVSDAHRPGGLVMLTARSHRGPCPWQRGRPGNWPPAL